MKNFARTAFNVAACVGGFSTALVSGGITLLSAVPHGPQAHYAPLFFVGGAILFIIGFANLLNKGKNKALSPPNGPEP